MTKQEFITAVAECTNNTGYSNPFKVVEAFGSVYVLNKKRVSEVKTYNDYNKASYLYIDMEKEYNLVINEKCIMLFKVARTPLMKAVFEFASTPIGKRR